MSIKENIIESNLEAMALSGIHLGASKSSGHPKMKSYIWSNRSAFQVIDLEQSQQCLTAAIDFLVDIRKKNGVILFVDKPRCQRTDKKNRRKSKYAVRDGALAWRHFYKFFYNQ